MENGFVIPSYSPAYNIKDINSELSTCSLLYTNGQSIIYKSPWLESTASSDFLLARMLTMKINCIFISKNEEVD